MTTSPLLYTLMGLLFGTTLLALGMAMGFWMAKRGAASELANAARVTVEQQNMLALMRNMASWTNDFAGDFTRYQSKMESLSRVAADGKTTITKEGVQKLLDQIVSANEALQSRLNNAELKLEDQTNQLAGYLTEARTDALTGLANRKAFDQKLDECFQKWHQTGATFSLAMVDVDHFKKVNDTYGHPAGDAVLKEMATRLAEIKHDSLLVARYGGEEFAILIDGPETVAAAIMERLRKNIAGKAFETDGVSIPVTMSCGVSKIFAEDRVGNLVRRADEALYSAKMGGRNRVFVHNGTMCAGLGSPANDPIATAPSKSDPLPISNDLEERIRSKFDHIIEKEAARRV
jgi:diguanylate cyclase